MTGEGCTSVPAPAPSSASMPAVLLSTTSDTWPIRQGAGAGVFRRTAGGDEEREDGGSPRPAAGDHGPIRSHAHTALLSAATASRCPDRGRSRSPCPGGAPRSRPPPGRRPRRRGSAPRSARTAAAGSHGSARAGRLRARARPAASPSPGRRDDRAGALSRAPGHPGGSSRADG